MHLVSALLWAELNHMAAASCKGGQDEFVEKKSYCHSTEPRLSNQDEISARSIVLLCQSYEIQSFTEWVA